MVFGMNDSTASKVVVAQLWLPNELTWNKTGFPPTWAQFLVGDSYGFWP